MTIENKTAPIAPPAPTRDSPLEEKLAYLRPCFANGHGDAWDKAHALGVRHHEIAELQAQIIAERGVGGFLAPTEPAPTIAAVEPQQDASDKPNEDTPPQKGKKAKEKKQATFKHCSDVLLADYLRRQFHMVYGDIVYAAGAIYHYNAVANCWQRNEDDALERRAHKLDGLRYSTGGEGTAPVCMNDARVKGTVRRLKAMVGQSDFFDSAKRGIAARNGFIAFDTAGEPTMIAHDRDHRVRHVIDAEWTPGADWRGTRFEKALERIFRGMNDKDDVIALLGEVFGCALLGHATRLKQPKSVFFFGKEGNNGKNTVVLLLLGLLPKGAVSGVAPNALGNEQIVAGLASALVNFKGEIERTRAIQGAPFKGAVSGDEPITAKRVYRDPWTFFNRALLLFACNGLPTFAGGIDGGIRRRLLVLSFPNYIPVEEQEDNLVATILETEMDALLAFAVEGAGRLLKAGVFSEPPSSKAALEAWMDDVDPVRAWFAACCKVDASAPKLSWATVHEKFTDWALDEGMDVNKLPGSGPFAERLYALSPSLGRAKIRGLRHVTGLRLLSLVERDTENQKV